MIINRPKLVACVALLMSTSPGLGLAVQRVPDDLPHEGHVVAGYADFNADDVPDYLVADPSFSLTAENAGALWIVCGKSGKRLWAMYGAEAGERLGTEVAAGDDVDGDGATDYFVQGKWERPVGARLLVISGASGETLFDQRGASICAAGDLDQDGRTDLFLGELRDEGDETRLGRNLVLSGLDGSVLLVLPRLNAAQLGERDLGGVGDVDGDGRGDLFVLCEGRLWIYSGKDGSVLHEFGEQEGRKIKSCVGPGDLDGDGKGDLLLGCPNYKESWILVKSGADGSELYRYVEPKYGLGTRLLGVGDVDGDGVPDFVSYGWQKGSGEGSVTAFSGGKGIQLYSRRRYHPMFLITLSYSVGVASDVDGDGVQDLIVGEVNAPRSGPPREGCVYLASGRTGKFLRLLAARDHPDDLFDGLRRVKR